MKNKLKIGIYSIALLFGISGISASETINGTVYLDVNRNTMQDEDEQGLAGILVSNGVDVEETDKNGHFELARVGHLPVFLIKPSGYQLSSSSFGQPDFYESQQSLKSGKLSFGLYETAEDRKLKIVLLGDTQPHNIDEVYYTLRSVDDLTSREYDFSIVLGDVVSDNPVILPLVKETIGIAEHNSYFTFGNHDLSWDSLEVHGIDYWDRDWIDVVGPTYYAMSWGSTNVISMNNINVKWNESRDRYDYDYFMQDEQLTFIENYLSFLDKDELLIVTSHSRPNSINNKAEFYQLFEGFTNVLFAFGHHHQTENYLIDESEGWPNETPAHCIGAGAVCGGHWRGEEDMFWIPSATMIDGSPKGYVFLDIDSSNYALKYKASGMPDKKQMHIYSPDHFSYDTNPSSSLSDNSFYANIYLGGPNTVVEYRINGGKWLPMQKTEEPDPYLKRVMLRQKLGVYPTEGARKLKRTFDTMSSSTHLWKAGFPTDLPYGVHELEVRFTDPYIQNESQTHGFIHLSPDQKDVNNKLNSFYKSWVDTQ